MIACVIANFSIFFIDAITNIKTASRYIKMISLDNEAALRRTKKERIDFLHQKDCT